VAAKKLGLGGDKTTKGRTGKGVSLCLDLGVEAYKVLGKGASTRGQWEKHQGNGGGKGSQLGNALTPAKNHATEIGKGGSHRNVLERDNNYWLVIKGPGGSFSEKSSSLRSFRNNPLKVNGTPRDVRTSMNMGTIPLVVDIILISSVRDLGDYGPALRGGCA